MQIKVILIKNFSGEMIISLRILFCLKFNIKIYPKEKNSIYFRKKIFFGSRNVWVALNGAENINLSFLFFKCYITVLSIKFPEVNEKYFLFYFHFFTIIFLLFTLFFVHDRSRSELEKWICNFGQFRIGNFKRHLLRSLQRETLNISFWR